MQDHEPYLSGKDTSNQQVIRSFLSLITERAGSRVGKTFPGQAICSPNSVQSSCPKEEFALAWSPTLPNLFPGAKASSSNEKSLIGRFVSVLSSGRKLSHMNIFHFCLQGEVREEVPKFKVFCKDYKSECSFDISDPTCISQGVKHRSLSSSRCYCSKQMRQ